MKWAYPWRNLSVKGYGSLSMKKLLKKIYFINNVFKNSSTFASPQVKILQLFQLSLKSFEDCDDENFTPIPSPNPPTNWTVISRDAHPQGKGVQKNCQSHQSINQSYLYFNISDFRAAFLLVSPKEK